MSDNVQRALYALEKLKSQGKDAPKPSVYYRNLRPELFSDTATSQVSVLPKNLLEFELDQLTTNKKEQEFEEFCRRLAQREICSNLVPQTGPVGGGDSKVDAATYPVAVDLAERRYWCGNAGPTSGDWAFAFSAKKDWRTKVRDDVAKISVLPRKFQKIFFITNQPARDKARAELEAELSATYGLPITILDRRWIVESVLASRLENLAIDCLGLDVGTRPERHLGPIDTAREKDLNDILALLADPTKAPQSDYALAQHYLEAAKLATELEHPRPEVEGLFLQAQNLAKKTGHIPLIIRCLYHHAWRRHFYYDDAAGTDSILQEMESHLPDVVDAEDAELFCNLCTALQTANDIGFYPQTEEKLKARNAMVAHRLETIASDQTRPNNALHAETMLHLLRLREGLLDKKVASECLAALKRCLKRSTGLGTYPLLTFTDIWEFYGQHLCDVPGYSELQEQLQRTLKHRVGQVEAGRRQLIFGVQLLEKGREAEALRQLAEAHINLAKEETRDDAVRAALACASAYKMLGLTWAARMELLSAAHVALGSVDRFHQMPTLGTFIALRMSWLELELGRTSPFLAWRNLTHGLLNQLHSLGLDSRADAFSEELIQQDGCFSCLLMKVPTDEVKDIAGIDECLAALDLDYTRFSLLYRTGRRKVVLDELQGVSGFGDSELDATMAMLAKQPAYAQVPKHLCDEARTICEFRTQLFGVRYRVRCRNKLGPILFAENLIGVLESALALAKWENLAFVADEVVLLVDETQDGNNPPSTKFDHFGATREQKLVWKPDMIEWMRTNPALLRDYLMSILLQILFTTTIDPLQDLEHELRDWYQQKSFERALKTTPTSVVVIDLLAKDKYDLNYWINGPTSSPV